jgi:hypothetical protein
MRVFRLALFAICSTCLGCASGFEEIHYFRSTSRDARGIPLNYFRVQVDGGTILSSSRYVSGYYDQRALDTYFNEFAQPEKGRIVQSDSTAAAATPGAGGSANGQSPSGSPANAPKVEPLDSSLEGKKLCLILSSNSDDIAQQIGTFAQTNALTADLEHLLGGGRLAASSRAVSAQQKDQVIAKSIVQSGNTELSILTSNNPSADEASQAALALGNQLAEYLGNTQQFTTLDALNDWVRKNGQGTLAKEAR